MKTLLRVAAVAAVCAAIAAWARYLQRRRAIWRVRLADAIPVNSAFWRTQKAKAGEVLYVAIGDSAAQGIGASHPSHSYVGVLARHIRARIGGSLRVVNLGISGATVRIAIESELPKLGRLEPDIVTVCIGANDIASFDEERFARDIRTLFDALPEHAVVADLPSFYFLPGQKRVRVANRVLRDAAAERNLTVVNLHARTDRQGLWGVSTQFAGDLFHPNDRGYRIWAAAFQAAVDRRIDQLR